MKPAVPVEDQIALLKARGLSFVNEDLALHFLKNISYYRLKGYWWDMQSDFTTHQFLDGSSFETVIDRYNFDRHYRLILFDAIERIEIALRTKMIYHMSLAHGPLWYADNSLFDNNTRHTNHLTKLKKEFGYSQEIFAIDHKRKLPKQDPESWKILEVASMGILSKFYENINHQLPAKSKIAKEMGLNLHKELSSWLEAITYVRNIIAHHSRLWSRRMIKKPTPTLNNFNYDWLILPLQRNEEQKVFLITTCLLHLCNIVTPNHQIKDKFITLLTSNHQIPIHKLGFNDRWQTHPIWL